jgi:preprotein translocase subunit SecE
MVLIMVVIISLFLYFSDQIIAWIVSLILSV